MTNCVSWDRESRAQIRSSLTETVCRTDRTIKDRRSLPWFNLCPWILIWWSYFTEPKRCNCSDLMRPFRIERRKLIPNLVTVPGGAAGHTPRWRAPASSVNWGSGAPNRIPEVPTHRKGLGTRGVSSLTVDGAPRMVHVGGWQTMEVQRANTTTHDKDPTRAQIGRSPRSVVGHPSWSLRSKGRRHTTKGGSTVAIHDSEEFLRLLQAPSQLGPVWFVANCATLCLRLVVQFEELTLGRKVRQSVAS
jgi:hypothetical protein